MDRLWAPWRMAYIMSTVNEQEDQDCVFCRMLADGDDERNLILRRGRHAFVVMNLFPYNTGHLMVLPMRHTGDFPSLTDDEHRELAALLGEAQAALELSMRPHGYNLGMNLGRVSGAGIVDHLHYHVVPRWSGDSNFMAVVADTKVISESLSESYHRLQAAFKKLNRPPG